MPNKADIVVGISDMHVTTNESDVLVTYSLGSCVGLALYDPRAGVGGLLHAMMPLSTADPMKAALKPAMYTDTGVTALLQMLFDRGATRRSIVAKVAGAGASMDGAGLFRIGERNHMVLRKILWKNDILIAAEDVGGSCARTLVLEMATGRTVVKSIRGTREL
ncbi:MAG: chemotaxis protein CheD [Actinobacteria bacterium HGW-Actinobacteria-10]|nr:MAG: chemotaxis protein CheD [Actinobacteria bacterium HGW-Actinobacteria-10]